MSRWHDSRDQNPIYDLTYCNSASELIENYCMQVDIKKYLGAPVQLTRPAYVCLRWGASKASNVTLIPFAIE